MSGLSTSKALKDVNYLTLSLVTWGTFSMLHEEGGEGIFLLGTQVSRQIILFHRGLHTNTT